ncbi:MAG: TetR/AcrR family transcriptional regulator [Pseudomonadota bacterium]
MSARTDARRADLRQRLVDAAEARVRAGGLSTLRARDLAKEAGCAVGAIYNVFDDMTALGLAVNARTFARFGQSVRDALAASGEQSPREELKTMGRTYLNFAASDPYAWRALFDIQMSDKQDVPHWYVTELGRLFTIIHGPLSRLRPDLPKAEIDLLTRALFSSVHGIVLLGLERRLSAVPPDKIAAMIDRVLTDLPAEPCP